MHPLFCWMICYHHLELLLVVPFVVVAGIPIVPTVVPLIVVAITCRGWCASRCSILSYKSVVRLCHCVVLLGPPFCCPWWLVVWYWTYVTRLLKSGDRLSSYSTGFPDSRVVALSAFINRFLSTVSYPSHIGFYTILGTPPPSHYLYYVEFLLCYKTVSADNSFWISTLHKYSILYMKTYLNTSFVLTSYLFI